MAWLQDPMAAASRWLDGAANAVLCRRRLLHAQSTKSRLQMDTRVSQGGRRPLVVVVVKRRKTGEKAVERLGWGGAFTGGQSRRARLEKRATRTRREAREEARQQDV
ncbi:hypothetical protein G6O67_006723 [Ophiocordyceps sinensis]|uniref:Uncharacterized protein n=1 Tax=Ophiocordyceps sinensis TaxID=72228 RepID=A0A8H4LWS5_9HYPO|nr:hypothetical protein G6O67_006723 [Ophiocordyceps sinensis]